MLRALMPAMVLGMLTACATTPALAPPRVMEAGPYKVGAGDRLRVSTFGEASLSGEYAVDAEGMIQFPVFGAIAVGGRTPAEIRDDLAGRMAAELLKNPRITVEIAAYRPVFILGEVAKPGEFPFSERMSATALIAKAGGFTTWANRKILYIRQKDETVERAYALTPQLVLRPGDEVRVVESSY